MINVLLLTFTGVFFLIPLEILDNLNKIFKLPGLIFGGIKGVECVSNFFAYLKYKLTRLNKFQLRSLEYQRKVTALLFENLPFTFLVFAIKLKLLDCSELSEGKSSNTVNISLMSTLV